MISKLPWEQSYYDDGTKELLLITSGDNIIAECMQPKESDTYVAGDNAEYITKACNMFPEVVEALRMVLHDTMNGFLNDKAEEIMSRAYSVLIKNKIEIPKFFKAKSDYVYETEPICSICEKPVSQCDRG
ncbi:hypothetical protein [Ruminiclostridium papyrosolvens]|uniref:Uncharacterized protein n=1 Tax=Ruminiclostridium papyrosolvens C7 TaxID=1330534 RepID=U4R3S2_9FIRM|nr:hypothetical protein [Ruminiclostridium papyrosolvens]EPR12478.1 hypothetical protein L323_07950 [Ruminiclostridium papyrosolvens C7]